MVFGYDNFNDMRYANNHQSGSDYRILGTGTIIRGAGDSDVVSRCSSATARRSSSGTRSRSRARARTSGRTRCSSTTRGASTDRLTANLGLRWDKNHGADRPGNARREGQRVEPAPRHRAGIRPATGKWSVTASFAKYVAAICQPDRRLGVGRRAIRRHCSSSIAAPSINAGPAPTTPVADRRGHPAGLRLVLRQRRTEPAAERRADDSRRDTADRRTGSRSPNAWEYAAGVNRQFGSTRANSAPTASFATTCDFYMRAGRHDDGHVCQDPTGRSFDLALITNAPDGLSRATTPACTFTGHVPVRRRVRTSAATTRCRGRGATSTARTSASGPVPFDYRVPRVQAGVVELSRRRSRGRSASPRPAVVELPSARRCRG